MPNVDLIEVARNTEYPLEAFLFVQRGLDFTVRRIHGELEMADEDDAHPEFQSRHVSGRDLCQGLRDFAMCEYGLLARVVLRRWKIHSCEDFGRIVFAMVDAGLMYKSDDDSINDFVGVFEFCSAFEPALQLSENL